MKRIYDVIGGDAALIITPVNRRYLTGFPSSDGYLFVTKQGMTLFMDGRYVEAAERAVKNAEVVLLTDADRQIKQFVSEHNISKLWLETEITVGEANRVQKNVCAEPSEKLSRAIEDMRITKTDAEIGSIRAAQIIAEKAFDNVLGFIKPGVTERDIALELDYYMLKHGAEAVSFETIAVSGKNTSMPHGVPSDKVVENGDFITMDFGAMVNGYHSDMTRTVAVGYADDDMKAVYETVDEAAMRAMDVVAVGAAAAEVDKAARDYIIGKGFGEYFNHSTGHGVGLEIHEAPAVSFRSTAVLKAGYIITIEPGIYIPGRFGVRIEDMLAVTDDGCVNLTSADRRLIVL